MIKSADTYETRRQQRIFNFFGMLGGLLTHLTTFSRKLKFYGAVMSFNAKAISMLLLLIHDDRFGNFVTSFTSSVYSLEVIVYVSNKSSVMNAYGATEIHYIPFLINHEIYRSDCKILSNLPGIQMYIYF